MHSPITPPEVSLEDCALRLRDDPESFLVDCRERFGMVFSVPLGGDQRVTYVLDPHLFQALLTSRAVDFAAVSRQSKQRFGLGKLVATQEDVRALSQDFASALRGEALQDTFEVMRGLLPAAIRTACDEFCSEDQVNLQELVQRTLVPTTFEVLFGPDSSGPGLVDEFLGFSTAVAARLTGSDPELDPAGRAAEQSLLERMCRAMDQNRTPVLDQLRSGSLARPDLSEEERGRTLLMLLWGSMVNLLPTSVWMLASVGADRELVETLRSGEAAAVGALRASIVEETLRLYSRPNMYRELIEDTLLGSDPEVMLKAGDWVALFPRLLHHDASVFQEPRTFDPRRFLSRGGVDPEFRHAGKVLRFPVVVFGLGQGRCPGDRYTHEALQLSLASWVSEADIVPVSPSLPVALKRTVASTPPPCEPIPVHLRRAGSAGR